MTMERPVYRRVASGQEDEVLAVLDESAAWLAARSVRQWPPRFEADWIAPAIARGETWLVEVGGEAAATVTLDWSDPLWDEDGTAGYVHRMAVRRWAAGLGAHVLAWAADVTRGAGRSSLRLDCVASNRRLRDHYESAGFAHRGDATAGGPPGGRESGGPRTLVSRYELALTPGRPPSGR
ncbi:GNAT family N-acetyltransferase [Nonomuraea sp. K274]|uniref:GNAT family N-acetyltransferase n=1 Tax=Nonomuraea cypriaca TaxID=1187855 RepID=A0A931AG57_9ACTN|nr:GNAT family N-acetyltransferase [Nonomuraea cypriaca]MBF8191353.1 GNAT family N-acetyltransferase [Nonomuraea cypriaca]